MPINWYPTAASKWPPTGYNTLEFSTLEALYEFASEMGWTIRTPNGGESRSFFRDARCDDGHTVTGVMLISPGGTYPFARCNGPIGLRTFLVPWGPDFVWGTN